MKLITIKSVLIYVLVGVTSLAAGSCCTKVFCLDANNIEMIYFYNFTVNELDTISIKLYDKNTNFASAIDSVLVITSDLRSQSPFQTIFVPDRITHHLDYKIRLNATGQEFTVSDFIITKEKCNSGFLCNDFFNALESYKINGQTVTSNTLAITK